MAIAILGGGILGVCTALDLADRGFDVTLFERNAELLSEASLHNEGKLHLGFVYAADRTFRTAERMIRGAAGFMDVLERWIPQDALRALPARPFDYLVHRDTMVSIDDIESHFARVAASLEANMTPDRRTLPLDRTRPVWKRRLHQRIDAGPVGRDRYLSVDTSKYTLAPSLSVATGDRVAALLSAAVR